MANTSRQGIVRGKELWDSMTTQLLLAQCCGRVLRTNFIFIKYFTHTTHKALPSAASESLGKPRSQLGLVRVVVNIDSSRRKGR